MHPDLRPLDLGARLTAVLAAATSAALGGPAWLSTTLVLAAAVAAIQPLARRRQLGWVDSAVVGTAGMLVALVLLGLVLNLLPSGLARVPWAVGAGLLAVAAIFWSRRAAAGAPRPETAPVDRRALLRTAPWCIAAVAGVVVAVVVSTDATDRANRAPASLSALDRTPAGRVVQVTGGPTAGRYELVTAAGAAGRRRYGPYDLAPGETVRVHVRLAAGPRAVVELRAIGTPGVLRSLVLR